jgi:uncharacterized protein (DUF4415 family)
MSLNRQFRQAPVLSAAKPLMPEPIAPATAGKVEKPGAKRGPKPSGNAKVLLTLRLHPATIAKFQDGGKDGWQRRMSDALDAAAAKL